MSRPPVTDWATDFDPLDMHWVDDPFPIWEDLRNRCPIAHTERFRGVYLPTRYEDIREVAYDTKHFSSSRIMVLETPPPVNTAAPPITSDPPHHRPARMVLLPAFTPDAIARLEPSTRATCRQLLKPILSRGRCDAATDYAQFIPMTVIARMLGLPDEDLGRFGQWVHDLIEASTTDPKAMKRAVDEMNAYFGRLVYERRSNPGNDLITFLTRQLVNDAPMTQEHILGSLRLLLVAGIDTTWSAIGASLWHLATHREDRERLINEPELIPQAVEEFLRAYAPVTMARKIVKARDVGGRELKQGQTVMLCFPAANRDPAAFPDPDKVVIDRKENRHAAFGLGIHRCIGSNLARMEILVALEEWLKAVPAFRLADGAEVVWAHGQARGPRKLPIVFN